MFSEAVSGSFNKAASSAPCSTRFPALPLSRQSGAVGVFVPLRHPGERPLC
ncbi:MAG: hypothetical protein MZU84_02675 [Sphingobacterium sp.]|nr:hypothetical protein [Sphingobacterium sp.]